MITTYTEKIDQVLGECRCALGSVNEAEVTKLADMILAANQVFFIGVGRVFLSLEGNCQTFGTLRSESNLCRPDRRACIGSGRFTDCCIRKRRIADSSCNCTEGQKAWCAGRLDRFQPE